MDYNAILCAVFADIFARGDAARSTHGREGEGGGMNIYVMSIGILRVDVLKTGIA